MTVGRKRERERERGGDGGGPPIRVSGKIYVQVTELLRTNEVYVLYDDMSIKISSGM